MRVVVVCDNEHLGGCLREIITRFGHDVAQADSGAEAFGTTHSSDADLVIVRGREPLIRALSASQWRSFPAQQHTPVIVISDAVLLEEELPHVYQFLPEPLDADRLLQAMQTIAAPLPHAEVSLTDQEFEHFASLLLSRTGLLFGAHNRAFLQRGIVRRMQVVRAGNFSEYYRYLTRHAVDRHEMQKLLQLITVGETCFLRYPAHFAALGELLQEKEPGSAVRCWSAGCSTGEEPYSLAMTVMEALSDWREREVQIFATDINRRSLKKAAEGCFSRWAIRGMEKDRLQRFFTARGAEFAVTEEVKALVTFSPLNLCSSRFRFKSAHLHTLDAVFCRNVLMYLDPKSAKQLIEHFASVLRPGGLLFLGHAEAFLPDPSALTLQRRDDAICFRKTAVNRSRVFASPRVEESVAAPSAAASRVATGEIGAAAGTSPSPLAPLPLGEGKCGTAPEAIGDDSGISPAPLAPLPLGEGWLGEPPPDDAAGELVLLGLRLAEEGRLEEARHMCDAALALDDLRPETYFLSALLLERTCRLTEALREYGKVILLDPRFVMPRYRLAELYLRLGREGDAAREYRNALHLLELDNAQDPVRFSDGLERDKLLAALRTALAQLAATPQQPFRGAV